MQPTAKEISHQIATTMFGVNRPHPNSLAGEVPLQGLDTAESHMYF